MAIFNIRGINGWRLDYYKYAKLDKFIKKGYSPIYLSYNIFTEKYDFTIDGETIEFKTKEKLINYAKKYMKEHQNVQNNQTKQS